MPPAWGVFVHALHGPGIAGPTGVAVRPARPARAERVAAERRVGGGSAATRLVAVRPPARVRTHPCTKPMREDAALHHVGEDRPA
ncbi:MAG: hypothetical protein ACK52I_31670 [Pseudomonadota bacterium]